MILWPKGRRDGIIAVVLMVVVALAAALRIPGLARRPMHGDEAVHAVKLWDLHRSGAYRYDPHEYHGPTLYYLTLPVIRLCGIRTFAELTETHLRLVPVLISLGLVPLLWLVRDSLGPAGVIAAAILTAASPAMAFYGRYYIQETLLVFFTFLMLAAGWRYAQSEKSGWAVLSGFGAGMAHATKETCIIAFACATAAWFISRVWRSRQNRPPLTVGSDRSTSGGRARRFRGIGLGVAAAVMTSVAFYSAFFTYPRGPLDSVLTYSTYLDRAGNYGLHDHPWWTYLQILAWTHWGPGPVWSEGVILVLFGVGVWSAGFRRMDGSDSGAPNPRAFVRYLALYTLLMIAVYSAIPYKTPWCLLSFLHGAILVAGFGAATILDAARRWTVRAITVVLLMVGVGHIGHQARLLTGPRFESDGRNPYVYAHPVGGVLRMTRFIEALAEADPRGRGIRIDVASPEADYWPLPWYLRSFENVGYWEVPPEDPAPIVVANAALPEPVLERLGVGRRTSHYGFRPDVVMVVSVDIDLFERFVERMRSAATVPWSTGTRGVQP